MYCLIVWYRASARRRVSQCVFVSASLTFLQYCILECGLWPATSDRVSSCRMLFCVVLQVIPLHVSCHCKPSSNAISLLSLVCLSVYVCSAVDVYSCWINLQVRILHLISRVARSYRCPHHALLARTSCALQRAYNIAFVICPCRPSSSGLADPTSYTHFIDSLQVCSLFVLPLTLELSRL